MHARGVFATLSSLLIFGMQGWAVQLAGRPCATLAMFGRAC
jgi:hypothetical protein